MIKSGRYSIHRPLVVGASAAASADLAAAFAEYGEAVGEASSSGTTCWMPSETAATGKRAGGDFTQHKMTILLGWAMQRDESIRTLCTEPGRTPDEVRRHLVQTGVPHDVEEHIAGLVGRAARPSPMRPSPRFGGQN